MWRDALTLQTNQHFSSDKNPNSLEDNKKKIEKEITYKKIEKEEQKWNKYADKELNHIAEKGIINAIKRNKLGSKVVVGGGSVCYLVSLVGSLPFLRQSKIQNISYPLFNFIRYIIRF